MQQADGAAMGKTEQRSRLVIADPAKVSDDRETIFCPCLKGLPREVAFSLGVLPVHDANAMLFDGLDRLGSAWIPHFAGVYLTDPFRRLDDILDRVEAAGISGVINLPTVVPFLDGETRDSFHGLHAAERRALDRAAKRGFETLFITTINASASTDEITSDGLDFSTI